MSLVCDSFCEVRAEGLGGFEEDVQRIAHAPTCTLELWIVMHESPEDRKLAKEIYGDRRECCSLKKPYSLQSSRRRPRTRDN